MNKTTKLILGAVIIVVAIIGVFFLTQQKSTEQAIETTQVKIADLPIVQGLPLYLAIEKGYFEEVGIDVERVRFDNPNQITDALLSGQVQFAADAATGITGIVETKNPGKLKIFLLTGGDNVVLNDAILVKTDSAISSIEDLKGKTLGILPGIQWRTIAQHILAQHNLTADEDVVLAELAPGLQAQALGAGQIDALLGVEPVPTIVKLNGIGKEIMSFATVKNVANPFYGGAGVVNVDFAKQNPDTTAKVLDVFDRAVKEIRNNPDQARQYLKEYTALTDELIAIVPISIFKMYDEFNEQDIDAVQNFYEIFTANGVVKSHIDAETLIYLPENL